MNKNEILEKITNNDGGGFNAEIELSYEKLAHFLAEEFEKQDKKMADMMQRINEQEDSISRIAVELSMLVG